MRIAVTGAAGFVGRHVIGALVRRGDTEVVAVTRHSDAAGSLPAGIDHVALDLHNAVPEDYDRLGRPEAIVHLAWGGLPNYLSLHHFETELPGQYRFCHAMLAAGLPALTVTGTCYEYGMQDGCLDEAYDGQPNNPYAFAKAALYRQLAFLKAKQPFALTWARLFYMHGEGQAPTSILPLLEAAVARGDATFPMSKGEQLRDYLPVGDVATALAALAFAREDAGIVNICSGEPISIRTLVERHIAGRRWTITPELGRYPYPTYEPLAFWGNRGKLDRLLSPVARADC